MDNIFLGLGKLVPITSIEKVYGVDENFVFKVGSTNMTYAVKVKQAQDIDFIIERENMETARSVLGDLVPKVYYANKDVLVMEWKEGVHIDNPDFKYIRDKLKAIKSQAIISNDPRVLSRRPFIGSSRDWMKHRVDVINSILKDEGFVETFPLCEFGEEEVFFQHNDLHSENVLVDPVSHEIVAVLDWAVSGFYPAHFEISKLNFRGVNHNLEEVEEIYQKVEGRILTAEVLKYSFSKDAILDMLDDKFFSEL